MSVDFDDDSTVDALLYEVGDQFPDDAPPKLSSVVVLKVQGDEVEIVDSGHTVLEYNGFYYDYTPLQYNDEFNNLITEKNIPIVQKVISNDDQINDKVSTVKGYALLQE